MRLNLGCGRVQFPLQPDAKLTPELREHLSRLPDSAYAPGWVNVDKFAMPGVQEAIDLFRFPWVRSSNGNPFNDSSVDEIFASHLVEHIPHQARMTDNVPDSLHKVYWPLVNDLDGFFVFFHECWRVLKPGGLMHVRCPYGNSLAGLTDPSHTRYLTAGSFLYLCDDNREAAPFDYHLPMVFEMIGDVEVHFTAHWQGQLAKYSQAGINELLASQFNVIDELHITLRAIKRD
jgi:hypothetical protein